MSSPPAETNTVLTSHPSSGITVLTINRPSARNAVNPATALALYKSILQFEQDATQRILILNGANGTFCAGFDLKSVAQNSSSKPHYDVHDVRGTIAPMGPSRLRISKPCIVAVSGYAVAGGLELSLLGDLRVVEEGSVFGVFCRRWGVPLIDGGTVRLQAIVGLGRALDMILTGRPVSATEALSMGLANRIVPKGQALAEATKLAEQLLQFPPICMNADRASAYHAAYDARSFEEAMKFEFANGVGATKAEGVEGARRFREGKGRGGDFSKL
ncbi:unnamed protein product [Zymoseptoria tritici ST99CH_1A5]|uniref:Enoyl-CoA hydratase n=1 Tax=Zymoseptoria tritici ST99CH_1A5 TaxID=1276529 RepID=A0A1Y6LCV6_ZYMTR|nr:unnamed protein product [Zymoseptoria tritici ST99CH_1A5]